jgi:predicted protein tyrosine phosphatase
MVSSAKLENKTVPVEICCIDPPVFVFVKMNVAAKIPEFIRIVRVRQYEARPIKRVAEKLLTAKFNERH